ncbi:MAG: ATP-binding protein, partial [Candidatus Cloacimonadota bacterium]|nr:ATP-binding protein [Candidatus Cloacimonadota bacterium]
SFKTSFEENLSQIVGNKEAIGVAIYNIIHNAVRHSPNNFTVVVGAKHSNFDEEEIDNQETVVIYIDDKGDGIDREKQDLLSSSFYEGNDIVSHQSGDLGYHTSSFGVGLSTVYRIVEIHQAKIWFKSKPQKGTTFFIAFPILKNIE